MTNLEELEDLRIYGPGYWVYPLRAMAAAERDATRCYMCGSDDFRKTPADNPICNVCHPRGDQ